MRRPPPQKDFWRKGEYTIRLRNGDSHTITITLEIKRTELRIPSPVRPKVSYQAELVGDILRMIFFPRKI